MNAMFLFLRAPVSDMHTILRRTAGPVLATLLAIGATGCGLLDDATTVTICTDEESFQVNAEQVSVASATAAQVPIIDCGGEAATCDSFEATIGCNAGVSCSVVCGDESQTCDLQTAFEQNTEIDLESRVKGQLQARTLSKVTLDRIEYAAPLNTLNFDTPEIGFFVGPASAETVDDPAVVRLAALTPISAGSEVELQSLPADQAGQDALAAFVRDYQTPFRIFARTIVTLEGGDPLPTGELQLRLKACFKASLL